MNIYFSGLGGVGLGPLAQIAIDAGHTVAGSDLYPSLTTDELAAQHVSVQIGPQDGEFLRQSHTQTPFDWFVYTAALPADHPELVLARELGIPTTKRDGLLAQIIDQSGQQLVAIAGTHGKTTTTSMMVWVLQQLNQPVSYSIGSQISFGPSGKFDPNAKLFIYECDEFDRNFLHFNPAYSLITSVEHDHPDTYPTEQEYYAAFAQFINQSDNCAMWLQDFTLGESRTNLQILDKTDAATRADIASLRIPGQHNRENAYLVLTTCLELGFSSDKVIAALETFPGSVRRFEQLAPNLYYDYGHHPSEIAATLQLAKEISPYAVLIYQPHQNVRQHEIQNQYTDAIFQDANEVYWTSTYLTREDPTLEVLTPQQLSAQLTTQNITYCELDDALFNVIQSHLQQGHLVLCMGAGTIDQWLRDELAAHPITPQS